MAIAPKPAAINNPPQHIACVVLFSVSEKMMNSRSRALIVAAPREQAIIKYINSLDLSFNYLKLLNLRLVCSINSLYNS